MPRVLFKRPWRTPHGRFEKSRDGVPSEVPERSLRRFPLPSDAEIVSADYIPPSDREPDDELADASGKTAAQIEAMVLQRADALIARREAEARGAKAEGVAKVAEKVAAKELADNLKGDAATVKGNIDEVNNLEDLRELLTLEEANGKRKGVLVGIQAAIDDLEDADDADTDA